MSLEKISSSEDYKIISGAVPIIASFEDEEINLALNKYFSSIILASDKKIPYDSDSLYNFISEVLTLGYNVCYNDSIPLNMFEAEETLED